MAIPAGSPTSGTRSSPDASSTSPTASPENAVTPTQWPAVRRRLRDGGSCSR